MIPADFADPPSNLQRASSTKTSIDIQWVAPLNDGGSAIQGYRVYVDGVESTTTPITDLTWSITGLTTEQIYDITVTTINGRGESDPTAAVSIMSATEP